MLRTRLPAAIVAGAFAVAGCATGAPAQARSDAGRIHVVAAENFWGSIATQLGGAKVDVTSVIENPNTDPHGYEPTPKDARAVASAQLVVVNGVGYDPWATRLLATDPVTTREVLNVGDLLGVAAGGNPHRWYDPSDVEQVVTAISRKYQRIDPADAGYFAHRRTTFETADLASYHRLIGEIKARYAGTPVGASESIFALLAPALGLRLVTPPGFLTAISEGAEPTASDKATSDGQIRTNAVKVYVYNAQNATPDVRAQIDAARRAGIPVTTITETMAPASTTFQEWQARQLGELEAALGRAAAKATGR